MMMKVQGTTRDIERAEYARLVGERFTHNLIKALATQDDDAVLVAIEDIADLGNLVTGITVDSEVNALAQQVGPFWSAEKVKAVLDVSFDQVLDEQREAGALLGVETADNVTLYPTFQFESVNGHIRVRRGFQDFFKVLRRQDAWSVAVLARTPSPGLSGWTPLEWVRSGRDPERLVAYASTTVRQWSQ